MKKIGRLRQWNQEPRSRAESMENYSQVSRPNKEISNIYQAAFQKWTSYSSVTPILLYAQECPEQLSCVCTTVHAVSWVCGVRQLAFHFHSSKDLQELHLRSSTTPEESGLFFYSMSTKSVILRLELSQISREKPCQSGS